MRLTDLSKFVRVGRDGKTYADVVTVDDLISVLIEEGGEIVVLDERWVWSADWAESPGRYLVFRLPDAVEEER